MGLTRFSLKNEEERNDGMLNYSELLRQLKKKEEHIITKLAIYHELTSSVDIEEVLPEDVDEIVEYLHNIYLNNDNMSYRYPKVAEAALSICDYELSNLLSSIHEDSNKLEKEILDKII